MGFGCRTRIFVLHMGRGVSAVKLIVMGDNNEGAVIDIDNVGRDFARLIEQFDRDPDNGVDLADGATLEVTDKIVCAGYGSQLSMPMAAETARVLRRYPPLSADDVFEHLDRHFTRLGFPWPTDVTTDEREVAVAIVRAAIAGDLDEMSTAAGQTMLLRDAMSQLRVVQTAFCVCCTLIAIAKGH